VLLKIPTYTHCAFLKENFQIKTDVGITRTLKTQEIIFMYKNNHFGRNLKNLCHITQQKQDAYMSFATKQNEKLKFKGV
jgi:hypothetical protein